MSLSTAQAMGVARQQQQQPGGVAVGHVPQQPDMGFGPNRYVPPTFNWGRGGLDGRQPNYQQMDWNQMQAFYMPQHTNTTFTNPYMQQLQGMLGQFSSQYGSPNRQPVMPQFGSYNPGFGGPTSFYDQMRGGGGGNALPEGYSYNAPEGRSYTMEMPTNGGRWAYGPNGERIEVGGNQRGPGADYFRNLFGGDGGGMQNPEGYSDRWSLAPSEMRGGNGGFMETIGGGGYPGGGFRGGFGGRGGYPQMPQFNPYMLARNNLGGMDFNQMFDPRFAMLFGMGGLGSLRPQGFEATQPQQPPSTANGQKPMMLGGG